MFGWLSASSPRWVETAKDDGPRRRVIDIGDLGNIGDLGGIGGGGGCEEKSKVRVS